MSSYNINRQAVPESELIEESQEQGGRLAARGTDGLKTYLYADSYEELFQELNCMGILPHQAVVASVPFVDEASIFSLIE
jgi:hypothetical protein